MTFVVGKHRFYDKDFAEMLESHMNMPYSASDGPGCEKCFNKNGFFYNITGYILNDGSGLFVEKVCSKCGTVTEEGDGDFHSHYVVLDGEIISKEGGVLMGTTMNKKDLTVDKGELSVIWQRQDDVGYSIILSFLSEQGVLSTEKTWSFGNEEWSQHVWQEWGDYVWDSISFAHEHARKLDEAVDALKHIDCEYIPSSQQEDLSFMHLTELDLMKTLIASKKREERHKSPSVVRFIDFTLLSTKLTVLWKIDQEYGEGYVIDLETFDTESGQGDLLHWSFGPGDSVEDVSYAWGRYIVERIEELGEKQYYLPALLDELGEINCTYQLHKTEDEREDNLEDLPAIYKLVGNRLTPDGTLLNDERFPPPDKQLVIIVDGGNIQEVLSDLDQRVTIIDYDDQDADPLDTIPLWQNEAFVTEDFGITNKSSLQLKFINDEIRKGKVIAEERKLEAEREPDVYYAAAYMISADSALTAGEVTELLTYLPEDVEMVPIEISQPDNNTSIIGFRDIRSNDNGEIYKSFSRICDNWELHPEDNVVITDYGHKAILLERTIRK